MITTKQRKEITRKAYEAIRALTGEQRKLRMISYVDADDKNGEFRFKANNIVYDYFDIKLKNGKIVSIVPTVNEYWKGKIIDDLA